MNKLNTEYILNIASDSLAGMDDIIFAYLFGSYAKEKQTHLSDMRLNR